MSRAYRASAPGGFGVTRDTPRDAALAFFAAFPSKRKCSVIEGEVAGAFFTVHFTLCQKNTYPSSWKDVTKKDVASLPDSAREQVQS
jgi:hypothetical protein